MSIKFLCATCGHKLRAGDALAGKRVRCTRCDRIAVVPAAAAPAQAAPREPAASAVGEGAPTGAADDEAAAFLLEPGAAAASRRPTWEGPDNDLPDPAPTTPGRRPHLAPAAPGEFLRNPPRRRSRLPWLLGGAAVLCGLIVTAGLLITLAAPVWGRRPVSPAAPPLPPPPPPAQIEVTEWYTGDNFSGNSGGLINLKWDAEPGLTLAAVKVRCQPEVDDLINMLPLDGHNVKLIAPNGKEYFAEGTGWETFTAPSDGGLVIGRNLSEIEQGRNPSCKMCGYLFAAPQQDLEAGRMRLQIRSYAAVPVPAAKRRTMP